MAAQFVDALIGYEFYLKARGKATIEEVNDYLASQERRPIKQRTYGHYRKLLKHGFRNYIPINQFDVFHSLGRLQLASDRRRCERDSIEVYAKISRIHKKWVDAVIIDKSVVGFGIQTIEKYPITLGSQMWVQLEGYGNIPTIVVWRKHFDGFTRIGTRAIEFITKYRLVDEQVANERLKGKLRIYRDIEGELGWDDVYRIIGKTDELLNSVISLVGYMGELIDSDVQIASPILSSIKFGSPGDVQIKVDLGVAEVIDMVVEKLRFWGLEKRKRTAETRKLELENKSLEIEILRKAISLRQEAPELDLTNAILDELMPSMKSVYNVDQLPLGSFSESSLERAILEERIIPAAAELVAGDDPDYEIEVSREE